MIILLIGMVALVLCSIIVVTSVMLSSRLSQYEGQREVFAEAGVLNKNLAHHP